MSERLENQTLRQKLSEADRLVRELLHHIEHGFIPKAHELRRTARVGIDPASANEITDGTMRSTADSVLASDDFTRELGTKIKDYLKSIDEDLERILKGK